MIPRGADRYWGADIDDVPDTRDDPPPDDGHDISDALAERWAREIGALVVDEREGGQQ